MGPNCARALHWWRRYQGRLRIDQRIIWFLYLDSPNPNHVRLQLQPKRSLAFMTVFRVGLFACIVSVVRLTYSILLHVPTSSGDYLVNELKIGLWRHWRSAPPILHVCSLRFSFAEMATGIIVGCLPILPKFFQQCSERPAPSSSKIKASSTKVNDRPSLSW